MMTSAMADSILDTMDSVALSAWTPYMGLFKSVTDLRAGTVTEADYTGYGTRPSVSFGAAGATSPAGGRQKANDAEVAFPQNTGATQDVIGWTLHNAATAGVQRYFGFLDADPPFVGVGNVDDTIDAYAHGLSTDQRVFVLAMPGAVIPTGLSENVAYYVLESGLTADVFKLSLTSGGAAVNISVGGAAMFMPYTALTVSNLATPKVAIGAAIVQIV